MLAYIALGSNLNHPKKQIKNALCLLDKAKGVTVINSSSLYQSKPIDGSNQPDYINAVCQVNTSLSALELLYVCQDIESQQQRIHQQKWGARTIDLDIIIYANQVIYSEKLSIPHLQIQHRAFVLIPLAELAPDIMVPTLGHIQSLIRKLGVLTLIKL